MMNADILQHIPSSPGIYLFKDKKGDILYIGKAKNLIKRVQQYFAHGSVRKQEMMQKSEGIDWIPVANESEALYLEDNLIKKHQPPFNSLLKGDWSYAYIKIPKTTFPQIVLTRKKYADGAKYIGPKHDTKNLKQFLQYTRQIRGRRSCTQTQFRTGKVCSDFYFGLCKGRCQKALQTPECIQTYAAITQGIANFFWWETSSIVSLIKQDMESAIHKQNFEWAAKLRDIYRKIEGMTQQQTVVLQTPYTGYIASITPLQKKWVRVLLQIQKGKLADVFRDITAQEDIDEASVKTMLELQSGSLKKKGNLYLSHLNPGIANEEQEQIIQLIERIRQWFLQFTSTKDSSVMNDLLTVIQQRYALKHFPYRMECVDISHLSGDWTSWGLSCMEWGLKNPVWYRRYRLPVGADDYASLTELLQRRMKYPMPDLLVIDGGKGQLMMIKKIFQINPHLKERCAYTDIICLGKGEARQKNKIWSSGKHGLVSEEIFSFDEKFIITKKKLVYDDADRCLTSLRDEAHRFANAYRKKQMSQEIPS